MQLVTVGEEPELCIPPPPSLKDVPLDAFAINVQLVTTGAE